MQMIGDKNFLGFICIHEYVLNANIKTSRVSILQYKG